MVKLRRAKSLNKPMKINKIIILVAGITVLSAIVTIAEVVPLFNQVYYTPPVVKAMTVTHEQETYVRALEWCESHGVITAVNPNDLDNTPSYYSWQWKPSTFRYFGVMYGVLPSEITEAEMLKKLADYETQRKVIEQMVIHANQIEWKNQFPGCTKKIGLPPTVIHTKSIDKKSQVN